MRNLTFSFLTLPHYVTCSLPVVNKSWRVSAYVFLPLELDLHDGASKIELSLQATEYLKQNP